MTPYILCTQPTFLPWIGYFDLLDLSTEVVFLDDIQFAKRSWQQRNKIRSDKGLEWLTVPVKVKGRFNQKIGEVEIVPDAHFPQQCLKTIKEKYKRSAYFAEYYDEFSELFKNAHKLCDLNIQIILWLSEKLGVEYGWCKSSELNVFGKKSELLVNICLQRGYSNYLSTAGSIDYLRDELHHFTEKKISVTLHNYYHPEYAQVYSPFIPYASIIDLLFNRGAEALSIIRSGRKDLLLLREESEHEMKKQE